MVNSMNNAFQQNDMYNQNYYPQSMLGNEVSNNVYLHETHQQTKGPSVLKMMTIGGIGAGAVGYFKNRNAISKDGIISDSFAKNVFDKHTSTNLSSNGKNFFKQIKEVIAKINKVKTPEEFKKLLEKNKMIMHSEFNGISSETILNTISVDNLKNKRKNFSKALNGWLDFNIQNMKDIIGVCWDKEKKKFVRPDNVDKKIFNAIKNTNMSNKWSKTGKYALIGAGITGILTIIYKKFISRFTSNQ